MALLHICTRTTSAAETAVADVFTSVFGHSPVVEVRPETRKCLVGIYAEPLEWTRPRMQALRTALRAIRGAGLPVGPLSVRRVRRQDWAESWKRHFKPIEVKSALLIKPSWSPRRPRRGQAMLILDPGLSFGTGQHHTTRFCLEQLVALQRRAEPQAMLDMGTGSGILAIAAAKLGYRPVRAFDNDADAVRIARQNARRNRVDGKIRFSCMDLSQSARLGAFDVVCANLIATVLMAQSRRIASALRPGASLVAAGILDREFGEVAKAFEKCGLLLAESQRERPWRSGVFRRA